MAPERWREVEKLYHKALERESAERSAFLRHTCSDEELRCEVEALLKHRDKGDQLLDRRPPETPSMLSVGMRLGPFEITRPIGVGGMGEVYEALDTRLDRKVAMKVASKQFSERFEREARAIAALNHPHICTLYDVGSNYLVMEFLEGDTLAERLQKGALPAQKVISYGAKIADALGAAHARGIIHRDLKPANVMLTKTGVKVLDFGLAKMETAETITQTNMVMGTPAYMAPEQREGKECDARTDIYTLGVMLHEMLMGKRPVSSEAIRTGAMPDKLAHAIERCLSNDPEERWQSAKDVKAELEWVATSPNNGSVAKSSSRRWLLAAAISVLL